MTSVTTHPGATTTTSTTPPNAWAPVALVLVNAIPLVGVLVFGWRLFDLMLLYWLENGVIGVFTVLKILARRASPNARDPQGVPAGALGKLIVACFFTVHYGIFWSVHGVFVLTLFGGVLGSLPTAVGAVPFYAPPDFQPVSSLAAAGTLALALASLFVSHGASYVTNFLGRGEDRTLTPVALMAQPYARVFVLHATLIGGGFVVLLLGSPVAALLLLVALKTGVDLAAHLREHRAVGRAT
ncbi:hypothetical protein BH23DEI1_BH23DEI1_10580 [soil metagenome]